MNEGMTWHHGQEVTAEDAAFTYNFILEATDHELRHVPHRCRPC